MLATGDEELVVGLGLVGVEDDVVVEQLVVEPNYAFLQLPLVRLTQPLLLRQQQLFRPPHYLIRRLFRQSNYLHLQVLLSLDHILLRQTYPPLNLTLDLRNGAKCLFIGLDGEGRRLIIVGKALLEVLVEALDHFVVVYCEKFIKSITSTGNK